MNKQLLPWTAVHKLREDWLRAVPAWMQVGSKAWTSQPGRHHLSSSRVRLQGPAVSHHTATSKQGCFLSPLSQPAGVPILRPPSPISGEDVAQQAWAVHACVVVYVHICPGKCMCAVCVQVYACVCRHVCLVCVGMQVHACMCRRVCCAWGFVCIFNYTGIIRKHHQETCILFGPVIFSLVRILVLKIMRHKWGWLT